MSLIDRYAPEVRAFRPDQLDYFAHLLSSWHGWSDTTGFIMPGRHERTVIVHALKRAVRTTLRNRP
jgi:hypothetical protein